MSVDDPPQTPMAEETLAEETLAEGTLATADPPRQRSCCYSRFWMDLTGTCRCVPSFRSVDVIYRTDGSSKTRIIDIPSSFSPPIGMLPESATNRVIALAKAAIVAWKLVVLALELFTFVDGLVFETEWFYFAKMTNWALLFSIVYSVLSLANTIFPVSASTVPPGIVSTRTSITWIFFTLSAVLQFTVTAMYWYLVYDGDVLRFSSVSAHGVIFVLIWVDGLAVNRIPVRLRHWFEICFPTFFAYVVWTVLQSPLVFDVDNPGEDDDKIYPLLDWSSTPLKSFVMTFGITVVSAPIIHLILWALSLPGRRYVNDNDKEDDDNPVEVGVGVQQACHP